MGATTAGVTGVGLGCTDGLVAADVFAPLSETLAPGWRVAGTGMTTEGTVLAVGDGVAVLLGVVAACACEPAPGKDRSTKTAATARTRTIMVRDRCI